MSKQFGGPYANLPHPTSDDAIYSTQMCNSPHGSGQLNYVNPPGQGGATQEANNAAINAAFAGNSNPVLSPTYMPPVALKAACDAWNVWWAQTHPEKEKGKKGDPSKKHG